MIREDTKAREPLTTNYPNIKISCFSRDSMAKCHADFDVWLYEVECLMKSKLHSSGAIVHAIRHSLKGDAAQVVMRLGASANVFQLI